MTTATDNRRRAVATVLAAASLGLAVIEPLAPNAVDDPLTTFRVPSMTPLGTLLALVLVGPAVDFADLDRALATADVRKRAETLAAAVYSDAPRRRRMLVETWAEVRAFLVESAPAVEQLAAKLARGPLQPHDLPRVDWPTPAAMN